jgi:hypothetical protein
VRRSRSRARSYARRADASAGPAAVSSYVNVPSSAGRRRGGSRPSARKPEQRRSRAVMRPSSSAQNRCCSLDRDARTAGGAKLRVTRELCSATVTDRHSPIVAHRQQTVRTALPAASDPHDLTPQSARERQSIPSGADGAKDQQNVGRSRPLRQAKGPASGAFQSSGGLSE